MLEWTTLDSGRHIKADQQKEVKRPMSGAHKIHNLKWPGKALGRNAGSCTTCLAASAQMKKLSPGIPAEEYKHCLFYVKCLINQIQMNGGEHHIILQCMGCV